MSAATGKIQTAIEDVHRFLHNRCCGRVFGLTLHLEEHLEQEPRLMAIIRTASDISLFVYN
jgi:hypothetical protein